MVCYQPTYIGCYLTIDLKYLLQQEARVGALKLIQTSLNLIRICSGTAK